MAHRKTWGRGAGLVALAGLAGTALAGDPPMGTEDWTLLLNEGPEACGLVGTDLLGGPAPLVERRGGLGPFSACVMPGTPDSVIAHVNQMMLDAWLAEQDGDFGERYNAGTRWTGTQGTPFTVNWSFVPDGVTISSGVGEGSSPNNLFAQMDSVVARATWVSRVQAIFDRWQALTGLNFVRVTVGGNDWDDGAAWGSNFAAGLRGHVRIAMHNIDGASGILAYNYFPQNGDMVLDSGDKNNFASSTNLHRFFRNTVAHEHGHGSGLSHVCSNNTTQLMEPFLQTSVDGPRQDDIRGMQRHYGDINEPDNTSATAILAGALGVGTINLGNPPAPISGTSDTFSSTLSIDANGEIDFHRLTTATPLLANFTLTPIGSTYDDADQQANGSCVDGPDTNALTQANLAFDVLTADGATIILTGSAQPSGTAESLTGVLLSPPGNFYVKVYEIDTPTQTQFYKATLTGTAVPTMSASDGTFTDKVQVTGTTVPGATSYRILRNTSNNQAGASQVATGATSTLDDTTAVPTTVYFYWLQAIQGAGGAYRDVAGPDTGFRASGGSPPGAFSLSSPADGAVDQSKTPTLDWTDAADVTTYTLKIDDTADLSSPISTVPGLASSTYNVPGGLLNDCTTYYWGVTAINSNGSTGSTPAVFSFTTRYPADYNHDGFVDGIDADMFNNDFEAGNIAADFNGDGFVDGIDYDEFFNHFESGC